MTGLLPHYPSLLKQSFRKRYSDELSTSPVPLPSSPSVTDRSNTLPSSLCSLPSIEGSNEKKSLDRENQDDSLIEPTMDNHPIMSDKMDISPLQDKVLNKPRMSIDSGYYSHPSIVIYTFLFTILPSLSLQKIVKKSSSVRVVMLSLIMIGTVSPLFPYVCNVCGIISIYHQLFIRIGIGIFIGLLYPLIDPSRQPELLIDPSTRTDNLPPIPVSLLNNYVSYAKAYIVHQVLYYIAYFLHYSCLLSTFVSMYTVLTLPLGILVCTYLWINEYGNLMYFTKHQYGKPTFVPSSLLPSFPLSLLRLWYPIYFVCIVSWILQTGIVPNTVDYDYRWIQHPLSFILVIHLSYICIREIRQHYVNLSSGWSDRSTKWLTIFIDRTGMLVWIGLIYTAIGYSGYTDGDQPYLVYFEPNRMSNITDSIYWFSNGSAMVLLSLTFLTMIGPVLLHAALQYSYVFSLYPYREISENSGKSSKLSPATNILIQELNQCHKFCLQYRPFITWFGNYRPMDRWNSMDRSTGNNDDDDENDPDSGTRNPSFPQSYPMYYRILRYWLFNICIFSLLSITLYRWLPILGILTYLFSPFLTSLPYLIILHCGYIMYMEVRVLPNELAGENTDHDKIEEFSSVTAKKTKTE